MEDRARRLAEQGLTGQRRLLKSHGDRHCGTRRKRLSGGRVSDEDLAGVDACSDLEREALVSLEVGVQRDQGISKVLGRSDRAERIVLVHQRDAEDRHCRVPDELLHGAAVPLDDRAHRVEIAPHDAAQHLRVESAGDVREIDDADEENRDRLPSLFSGCRLGARLFGETELRVVTEDRLLEPLELGRGLDPQLFDQGLAGLAIGIECFGLPAGAVESEHQLPAQSLPQRILGDERLELPDQL